MGWAGAFGRKLAAVAAAILLAGISSAIAADELVPAALDGVTLVAAAEINELRGNGAQLIDTRPINDYLAHRIPGARHAAYRELSARTIAFDPTQDDVAAFLSRLHRLAPDRAAPVIFYCNGIYCWKSYKASVVARHDGYRSVYWFRGGLAEWGAAGGAEERD